MVAVLKTLLREDRGQGMVEYALLVALISVFVIAAVTLLRTQLQTVFNRVRSGLMST